MANKRSDSSHVQAEIMAMAANGILPPAYCELKIGEMPFWNAIIAARVEWTTVDLMHAANLARTLFAIETETASLRNEGSVIMNQRGSPVMNPRFSVLETLSRRSVSISSKIQVHAAATIGESENNRKKNSQKRKSMDALNGIDDDDEDLLGAPVN